MVVGGGFFTSSLSRIEEAERGENKTHDTVGGTSPHCVMAESRERKADGEKKKERERERKRKTSILELTNDPSFGISSDNRSSPRSRPLRLDICPSSATLAQWTWYNFHFFRLLGVFSTSAERKYLPTYADGKRLFALSNKTKRLQAERSPPLPECSMIRKR